MLSVSLIFAILKELNIHCVSNVEKLTLMQIQFKKIKTEIGLK